jgi:uncharacterized membrane protein
LAAAKVFIYDLAFLNTSYRVLSFIGLGVLLLACSYLYQRVIAPVTSGTGDPEEPPVDNGNDELTPAGLAEV